MTTSGVIPYSRHRLGTLTIRRRYLAVTVVIIAVASAVGAGVAAAIHHPDPGLSFRDGVVDDVLPGGPSWNNGVREGHVVVELEPGSEPTEWRLVTTDGHFHYASTALSHVITLRETLLTAVASLLAALGGAALLRRAPVLGTGLAVLAIVLATVPFSLSGDAVVSTVASVTAPLLAAGWLASWGLGRRGVRLAVGLGAVATTGLWLFVRFFEPRLFPAAEAARVICIVAAAIAVVGLAVPWRSWTADGPVGRGRGVDMALVGVAIAGAALLGVIFALPLLLVGAAVMALVLTYSAARRRIAPLVDRLVFAELREGASLAAVEEERARLAADLHDVPLQELTGIIHRLEGGGELADAPELLRRVAAHIRAVTTELRPPVLDDLGLGPAIAFLADEAAASGVTPTVSASVVDRAGIEREERVPPLVELAIFRIVQEALANARQHAHATRVWLEGEITPRAVDLVIRDDGSGITAERRHAASHEGHLGLAAMRARAAAIDAVLVFDREEPSGTRISVVWRAL